MNETNASGDTMIEKASRLPWVLCTVLFALGGCGGRSMPVDATAIDAMDASSIDATALDVTSNDSLDVAIDGRDVGDSSDTGIDAIDDDSFVVCDASPDGLLPEPPAHRRSDSPCAVRPPGTCGGRDGGACATDDDCTAEPGGRCNEDTISGAVCSCRYDSCTSNDDCPTGTLCFCGADREGAPPSYPNLCVLSGECRADSDCAPGSWCAPSPCIGAGLYCHTPCDECLTGDPMRGDCVFDPAQRRWVYRWCS